MILVKTCWRRDLTFVGYSVCGVFRKSFSFFFLMSRNDELGIFFFNLFIFVQFVQSMYTMDCRVAVLQPPEKIDR